MKTILRRTFIALALGALTASAAFAQADFPSRTLRLIVPFPPGGSTDTLARLIAQRLGDTLGQSVIIDNKPGAGGNIGMDLGAKAVPDGYTIFLTSTSTIAVNPTLYAKLSFDPDKDVAPVILLSYVPNILVVNASLPARNIQELISLFKANPGKFNYASPGNGNSSHLAAELFKSMAGLEITHVPYKGDVPAITDLMAGQVQMMFMTSLVASTYLKDSRLRALAIAGPNRLASLPNVPTVADAGLRGFDASAWFGLSTQGAVPTDTVAKLNAALNKVLQMPEVRQRMEATDMTPGGGTPQDYGSLIARERIKWGEVVRRSGARVD